MELTPSWCRTQARYNAWQNRIMHSALDRLSPEELQQDRGAFFGSIFATLNHLLWADRIWMSRLAGLPAPQGGIAESTTGCPTLAVWSAERFRLDARMLLWAEELRSIDLHGALTWHSAAAGQQLTRPRGLCIAHMFNHQTHHRGQIHAMLTATGRQAWVSDLFLMPQDPVQEGWRHPAA